MNGRAATSGLLSGSDEDGKGRGKWTLRNTVQFYSWSELKFVSCQVMVKKEKKKRRERTRKVRNKAVVCVCLDVKM